MNNYNGTDIDAQEAIDRDIEAYKEQLAEEEARDEAMLQDLQERYDNQYVCGDTDHHHWG